MRLPVLIARWHSATMSWFPIKPSVPAPASANWMAGGQLSQGIWKSLPLSCREQPSRATAAVHYQC
jgi:hypothetical protein